MNKRKVGITLGILSIITVLINIVFFFTARGPTADIYAMIKIFTLLSLVGIVFSICSYIYLWLLKEKQTHMFFATVGFIANVLVLVYAFFLLLAMGIGEP